MLLGLVLKPGFSFLWLQTKDIAIITSFKAQTKKYYYNGSIFGASYKEPLLLYLLYLYWFLNVKESDAVTLKFFNKRRNKAKQPVIDDILIYEVGLRETLEGGGWKDVCKYNFKGWFYIKTNKKPGKAEH